MSLNGNIISQNICNKIFLIFVVSRIIDINVIFIQAVSLHQLRIFVYIHECKYHMVYNKKTIFKFNEDVFRKTQ